MGVCIDVRGICGRWTAQRQSFCRYDFRGLDHNQSSVPGLPQPQAECTAAELSTKLKMFSTIRAYASSLSSRQGTRRFSPYFSLKLLRITYEVGLSPCGPIWATSWSSIRPPPLLRETVHLGSALPCQSGGKGSREEEAPMEEGIPWLVWIWSRASALILNCVPPWRRSNRP